MPTMRIADKSVSAGMSASRPAAGPIPFIHQPQPDHGEVRLVVGDGPAFIEHHLSEAACGNDGDIL